MESFCGGAKEGVLGIYPAIRERVCQYCERLGRRPCWVWRRCVWKAEVVGEVAMMMVGLGVPETAREKSTVSPATEVRAIVAWEKREARVRRSG